MPTYAPIRGECMTKSSQSDLIDLRWHKNGITADFILPNHENNVIRVAFDRVDIIRILDEMPLSTEKEETPNEGLVPDHFAYLVEGASFWQSQSEAFKAVYPAASHYRFITGWTRLDAIASAGPTFSIVATSRTNAE